MKFLHYPVMHKDVIEIFDASALPKKCFVDCTLGMGGHTGFMLQHFRDSEVIAIDVDAESMEKAKENLQPSIDRVHFHRFNYTELFKKLDLSEKEICGMLIDPGISIYQLQEKERGFSHRGDAPLDMRKDQGNGDNDGQRGLTAYDIINTFSLEKLKGLLEQYGELRNAGILARRIIETRLYGPIESTGQLTELVAKVCHWRPKPGKIHPAAKVFQALRIVVNRELEGIEEFLDNAAFTLNAGARIIFLTFHSVEDRLIKKSFVKLRDQKRIKILKPFPRFPSDEEVAENSPSRSVKLRAVEVL